MKDFRFRIQVIVEGDLIGQPIDVTLDNIAVKAAGLSGVASNYIGGHVVILDIWEGPHP